MFLRKLLPALLVVLAASIVVATSLGAPDRKAPRLVRAAMQDTDGDGRADRVRLIFSERIRHASDRDGKYPFRVAGYKIRSVGPARGRTLVLVLAEKARADEAATPVIRYKRTRSKPVRDRAGNQAARQTLRSVRPHGKAGTTPLPPPSPPPPPPNPALPPDADPDRDGYQAPLDCQPDDPAIHPGAEDLPDLAFVDSNCDGIDGTEAKAVFASPLGNDANPGTKAQPKRQIQTAVTAASLTGRYVLAAAGSYAGATAASGVGIYGGYEQTTWSRGTSLTTQITGGPQGVFADGATAVVLQLLSVAGHNDGARELSAYGIRAINGSTLSLQRVRVSSAAAAPGTTGANGAAGRPGDPGLPGARGACDSDVDAPGGAGGESPVGRDGGKGGDGRYGARGEDGAPGIVGTPGGKGGPANPGAGPGIPGGPQFGEDGQGGANGPPGTASAGGDSSTALASLSWRGRGGIEGIYGAPGNGGGGGGAGGGQTGYLVYDGTGNGGGGGGGGGEGGRGGAGGGAGGGSFGVYLYNSTIASDGGSIAAGKGGPGGRGGNGGPGGAGGKGAEGFGYCLDEIGYGGDGGKGGNGGQGGGGGGGAGGPSFGIFKAGTSTATLTDSTVTNGSAGAGGTGGNGGIGPGGAGAPGIASAVFPA